MRILSCLLLFAFFQTLNAQQLAHRSQISETGFLWNPAMTAPGTLLEYGATYRQQWLGFDGAPRTATASGQFPFVDYNMSVGAFLVLDQSGPIKNNEFAVTYAYKLRLGLSEDDQLSIGLLASMSQLRFDASNEFFNDADDPILTAQPLSKIQPNVGVGFFYLSNVDNRYDENVFYIGVSTNQTWARDVVLDNEANLKRAIHGYGILGFQLHNDVSFFEPSFWFHYSEPNVISSTINLRYEMKDVFWAGLNYMSGGTLGLQGGIILGDRFFPDGQLRLGSLAAVNIGSDSSALGFGYEFYLAYRYDLD